jgi:hypothetical protein
MRKIENFVRVNYKPAHYSKSNMKQKTFTARITRLTTLLNLIFCAGIVSVQAQENGTVIPRVCTETAYYNGTVTLAADAAVNDLLISVNGYVPPLVSLVINPGGANQEIVPYVHRRINGNNPFTLGMTNDFQHAIRIEAYDNVTYSRKLIYAHSAGETVRFEGYSGTAYFGYNNTNPNDVSIQRGVTSYNYFSPGPISQNQTTYFLRGIHDSVFGVPFGGRASDSLTWNLTNLRAAARNGAGQGCGTITYQGRLSDSNAAANGQYDLQFTVYDALSGGAAQSESVTIEDVSVSNGIFTVQLNFGSTFSNNLNARFLEIAVRAGTSTGAFTVLTPRQPVTSVPFAVNAQIAQTAINATNATQVGGIAANQYVLTTDPRLSPTNNTNFIQNTTTAQTANFNITGNGTIGGNLTVTGTLNATLPAGSANYIQNTTQQQANANINISGTISSGCRPGFTAIAGGRLCVSAMQPPATFNSAMQVCTNMGARVGNSADAMLTFSQSGFNYFLTDNPINSNDPKGWLADIVGDNVRATWNVNTPANDFDGIPLNVYNGSPSLLYRCVY